MKIRMREMAWGYLFGRGFSVKEIALGCGLSRQAVNNALNSLPDIKELRLQHNVSKARREFESFQEKQRGG